MFKIPSAVAKRQRRRVQIPAGFELRGRKIEILLQASPAEICRKIGAGLVQRGEVGPQPLKNGQIGAQIRASGQPGLFGDRALGKPSFDRADQRQVGLRLGPGRGPLGQRGVADRIIRIRRAQLVLVQAVGFQRLDRAADGIQVLPGLRR